MRSDLKSWSPKSIVFIAFLLLTIVILAVLFTTPMQSITGQSIHALHTAMHGIMSFIFVVISTIALYIGWELFNNRLNKISDIQLLSVTMSICAFVTIVSGNWIYIFYRAADPSSPRSWLLKNIPEVHTIFFEFKEFISLFTFPLAITAMYISLVYGSKIFENKWLRTNLSVLFALIFFYLVIAFGLGAAVAKIRPL